MCAICKSFNKNAFSSHLQELSGKVLNILLGLCPRPHTTIILDPNLHDTYTIHCVNIGHRKHKRNFGTINIKTGKEEGKIEQKVCLAKGWIINYLWRGVQDIIMHLVDPSSLSNLHKNVSPPQTRQKKPHTQS